MRPLRGSPRPGGEQGDSDRARVIDEREHQRGAGSLPDVGPRGLTGAQVVREQVRDHPVAIELVLVRQSARQDRRLDRRLYDDETIALETEPPLARETWLTRAGSDEPLTSTT